MWNKYIMLNNFLFENHAVFEIMWKHIFEWGKPPMAIWRIRIVWWVHKAANTHSDFIILNAVPSQQWLHERASMLRYCTFPFLFYLFCLDPRDELKVKKRRNLFLKTVWLRILWNFLLYLINIFNTNVRVHSCTIMVYDFIEFVTVVSIM
jgi:hypothetical protein